MTPRERCHNCDKLTRRPGGYCYYCRRLHDVDIPLSGGRWELGPRRVQRWVDDEAPAEDDPPPRPTHLNGCADCGEPLISDHAKRCAVCAREAVRMSWRESKRRARGRRAALLDVVLSERYGPSSWWAPDDSETGTARRRRDALDDYEAHRDHAKGGAA